MPLAYPAERAELAEIVRELHPPKPRAKGRPAQLHGYTKLGALYKAGKAVDPKRVAAEVAPRRPRQKEQMMARAAAMKTLADEVLCVLGAGA